MRQGGPYWQAYCSCPLGTAKESKQLSSRDLTALLIASLSNLQRCSLRITYFTHGIVRSEALRAAGISQLPLETINIALHKGVRSQDMVNLNLYTRDLFQMAPNLETLNLHMCEISEPCASVSPSNLKTIRITHSWREKAGLKTLLSSCHGLRNFYLESTNAGYRNLVADKKHLQSSHTVACLKRYRKTLQSLHLDLRGWRNALGLSVHNLPPPPPLPSFSFRHFTALEHIFINTNEIYSERWASSTEDSNLLIQLLPLAIASLHLAGPVGKAIPGLARGLYTLANAVLKRQFQRPEQVRCDAEERLDRDDEDAVGSLFASAGVSFGYESWPLTERILSPIDIATSDNPWS